MSDLRRCCIRTDGKCGDQWCGKKRGESCVYEYVETGGPHDYKGEKWPPPSSWKAADGTHVYRTYSDYCD